MPEIGATLREARMRARIDISEIEAQTKIRAKYLRALENEEWDLLPGPAYVGSFLRTYAQALGLDAKLLMEEYRLRHERPTEAELQPIMPQTRRRSGGSSSRGSRRYTTAIGSFAVLIVVLLVALLTGGSSTRTTSSAAPPRGVTGVHHHRHTVHRASPPAAGRVALQVRPSGPVYVCLLDARGRKLIPGVNLAPGSTPRTYRSTRFDITLGNNLLTLRVNGRDETVPASQGPLRYAITSRGRRSLPPSRLPCA